MENNASGGEKSNAELKKHLREEKQREAKIEEQLTKLLTGIASPEEKLQIVYKRLVESEKENKKLLIAQKQFERMYEALKKEKETLHLELNRQQLTRTKLESLCRELQKQNKQIKDESMAKIKEEEEKRKETQERFQKSLNEIQQVMNENNEKNQQLKDDNMEMAKKFKFILEQYELRDQQMDKINKQMDLVTQLNDAKLAKAQMEGQAEKEKFMAEKTIIMTELTKCKKQLSDLQQVEVHLREQVNLYSDKYGEFQDSLKKSHNIFVGYKDDMEKMSKKIHKLEKETAAWKSKWEKANNVAIDLASEKQVRDAHIQKTAKQLFHLQKLCRTLHNERTAFSNKLKECDIELPQVVEVPCQMPEPEPEVAKETDRLEVMTKNCATLKETLAQLQGQLTTLQSEEQPKTQESSSSNKKSKNKKNKKEKSPLTDENSVAEVGIEEKVANGKNEEKITENSLEIAVGNVEVTDENTVEPMVTETTSKDTVEIVPAIIEKGEVKLTESADNTIETEVINQENGKDEAKMTKIIDDIQPAVMTEVA